MSTLFIRLPAHASLEQNSLGTPVFCHYALVANGARIARDGMAALADLGQLIQGTREVVVFVAASDVTLLRVKMPPLSGPKLKAALPNLVEEQLIGDPSESVVVAGAMQEGLRTVAVVSRKWLESVTRVLTQQGAQKISAYPVQLCLPIEHDTTVCAVLEQPGEHGGVIDLAVRSQEQQGLGIAVYSDADENAALEVAQTLAALIPQGQIVLAVPPNRMRDYQSSLALVESVKDRTTLVEEGWARWIHGARQDTPNLMSGLVTGSSSTAQWKSLRWPLVLASALVVVNLVGLNLDWLKLRSESADLRAGMLQNYRAAFPNDTVIVDPLAQARQKVAAQSGAGAGVAPDDFLALTAALAQSMPSGDVLPIASLEYRERSLFVRIKEGANIDPDAFANALSSRELAFEQQGSGVWQIRRAR